MSDPLRLVIEPWGTPPARKIAKVVEILHGGGVAAYRASEGKTVTVPYRGPVEGTMQEIMGGVRSAMTYIGAVRLKEMSKRTTFIMVGAQLNTVFGN